MVSHEWDGNLHTRTQIFNLAALPSPLLKEYGVNAGALKLDANINAVAGKPLHISGEGEITHLGWHRQRRLARDARGECHAFLPIMLGARSR